MIRTKIQETTQRMATKSNTLSFGEKKYNYFYWIVYRYLHYMTLAIIHGYQITVWKTCKIGFAWSAPEFLNRQQKARYMFSPLIFDYMFSLSIKGRFIDSERFTFSIDKRLKKRFEEKLSTDAVYQFIRK